MPFLGIWNKRPISAPLLQMLRNVIEKNINGDVDIASHGTGSMEFSPQNVSFKVLPPPPPKHPHARPPVRPPSVCRRN